MKFSIMITVLVFTLISPVIKAQNSISLNDLYEKISVDYPSAKKQEIEAKIATLNEQIAGANLYPELIISGRASYQSGVV